MHEEWTDHLSDYLDGELPDEERRAVDAHLRGCIECTAVLNDLKRVVARAEEVSAAPRPPAEDLWAGIAARIEPRRSAEDTKADVAAFAPRVPRHVTFTLAQLAVAAALLIAVSGTVAIKLMPAPPAAAAAGVQRPEPPATREPGAREPAAHVVPASIADAQYDAAVADLAGALKQGRGRLDASTIGIVEHNLQIIDQAIDQAREALAADPANTYLSGHLVEARRRKLDLLRRAAALSESN